jgi:hypothetical protein
MPRRSAKVLIDAVEPDEPRWSKRASWLSGGESIYALLGKFGALNALSNRDLCELFVPKHERGRGHPSFPVVDLRTSERIRKARLANLFGLDAGDLSNAFVSELFPNALQLSSPTLVWCPRCAHLGFHSAAFQLNFYRTCPVHRTPFRRACSNCGSSLAYTLSARHAPLFTCSKCGIDLASELRTHRPTLKLDDRADAILHDHVQLVRFTDTLPTLFNACKSELGRPNLPIQMGKADVFRRCSAFQQFVTDVLTALSADLANPQLAPLRPTGVFHVALESPKRPSGRAGGDEPLEEAYGIYRAVRRGIYRHVCRGHAVCIRAAQRALWWDLEGERTTSFCPTAMAYLRWRMQWEGCRIPGMLDSRGRVRTLHGILGWLSSEAPIGSALWTHSLDGWIHSQLLATALVDSFAQWQEVTAQATSTVVWRKSIAARFGKRHWACSGRGTLAEPALFYLEPAYLPIVAAPPASGAHVRRTRSLLQTIRR